MPGHERCWQQRLVMQACLSVLCVPARARENRGAGGGGAAWLSSWMFLGREEGGS